MDRLVIDRSKWLRGEGGMASSLFRGSDNKMCCLGFLGIACGASIKQMQGVAAPGSTHGVNWPEWLGSELTDRLMNANDARQLIEEDRELRVRGLFAPHLAVEFIDSDPSAPGLKP